MDHVIPYNLSRDYTRLKELLDKGYRIVCFVDYDFHRDGKRMVRDVCTAKRMNREDGSFYSYKVLSRGHEYMGFDDYEMKQGWTFEQVCESSNLEFIDIEE